MTADAPSPAPPVPANGHGDGELLLRAEHVKKYFPIRSGILLAGITGVIIRELLDKEEPREEMDALRADRFWRW